MADVFERLLDRDCSLRFVMLEPESDAVPLMADALQSTESAGAYKHRIERSLDKLLDLKGRYPKFCSVRLLASSTPLHSIFMVERDSGNSILNVGLYCTDVPARDRPVLPINKAIDPLLYELFSNEFARLHDRAAEAHTSRADTA